MRRPILAILCSIMLAGCATQPSPQSYQPVIVKSVQAFDVPDSGIDEAVREMYIKGYTLHDLELIHEQGTDDIQAVMVFKRFGE